jgi:predicted  nucleic acid-binding Zn-ribbon protein
LEAARTEQLAATALCAAAVARERVAVSERDTALSERDTANRELGDVKRRLELLTSELEQTRIDAEQARNEATAARNEALKITGDAQRAKLEAADSVGGVQSKIKSLTEELAAVTKREEELITLQQMDETRVCILSISISLIILNCVD